MVSSDRPPLAPLSWLNTSFLALVHLTAIAGTVAYFVVRGPSLAASLLAFLWTGLTIFALSAGYHRLFSHRTYEAHPLLRASCSLFGAGHLPELGVDLGGGSPPPPRTHRQRSRPVRMRATASGTRTSAGCCARPTPAIEPMPVPDLERDPLVVWQDRHYPLIGIAAGVVAAEPARARASATRWAASWSAGALRLVFVYHVTFSINSFAHCWARSPTPIATPRATASSPRILSMGEGYHNFHHTFPPTTATACARTSSIPASGRSACCPGWAWPGTCGGPPRRSSCARACAWTSAADWRRSRLPEQTRSTGAAARQHRRAPGPMARAHHPPRSRAGREKLQ